ncbi:Predicted hydrolase of the alpha/beta superfamily [Microbulbifer donghaiensis]|uniref:Predicted hydrolase of the alpha/beta superfamily n=1 Tax=Microbulbifer donghaiensis TaxID=494016 RepID=A0A1M5FDG4_9GAMM|nr:alpha/beta hydrolase-fold protein [Microbulbifer donghaiensis]SHF89131.1 Predicted hydrolase of the alpha/beta superfamily [Microbulbifer donghaiensis]
MITTINSTRGRKAGRILGRAPRVFRLGLFTGLLALLLIACDGSDNSTATSTAQANVTTLSPLTMEALQRQRTVRIYLPPSYDSSEQRYPVLYMHDGQNLFDDATSFVGEWGVDETLNGLAASHGLEVIVVGIDHGGDQRMTELNPYDHEKFGAGEGAAYLRFVVEQLKPQIDRDYRTLPDRDNTAIMGSSMGGLISHYAINRYPQVFSKAGIFSPAYWVGPQILPMAEQAAPQDARLYLLMGGREGDEMVQNFERMGEILSRSLPAGSWQAKLAADGEHNEKFWRGELADALLWLFQRENFAAQTVGE